MQPNLNRFNFGKVKTLPPYQSLHVTDIEKIASLDISSFFEEGVHGP